MSRHLWLTILLACGGDATDDLPPDDTGAPAGDDTTPADTAAPPPPDGPGLGNLSYTADELFTPVGWIDADNGVPTRDDDPFLAFLKPLATNVGYMVNGYFLTLTAPDSGGGPGGLLVYDVSDPRDPTLVTTVYEPEPGGRTAAFREAHSMGFRHQDGRDLVALHTGEGIAFWDVTDMRDLQEVSTLALPGVSFGDYDNVSWQLFWQGSTVYVGGAEAGVYIVDASDPANPVLADRGGLPNPVPPSELGGFRVGPLFAVGNLLIVSSMDNATGYATLDISDPHHPSLLTSRVGLPKFYATCFSGGFVYGAARGEGATVTIDDVRDPWVYGMRSDDLGIDHQLYCGTQDQHLFVGGEHEMVKVDVSDPTAPVILGRGSLPRDNVDHGQVQPMGNLVFVGNDHGTGSAFVPHQAAPDTTPPAVSFVHPEDGAAGVGVRSRVGVTFTDAVEIETVGPETFTLREVGGEAVPGTYTVQGHIVNLEPDAPLAGGTAYELVVAEGGVTDWVGNAVAEAFTARFETAQTLGGPVIPGLVGYWPMADEPSGERVLDRSGRGRSGVRVGDARATPGAVVLEGAGGVRIPDADLGTGGGITVLVRANATPGAAGVLVASAPGGWSLAVDGDDVVWTSGGVAARASSSQLADDGQVAVVARVARTGEVALSVGGEDDVVAPGGAPDTPAGDLWFGRAPDGSQGLEGAIAEVRIYDRAVTDDERSGLLAARSQGAPLWAWIPPVDPVAVDASGRVEVLTARPLDVEASWRLGLDADWVHERAALPRTLTFDTPGHHTVLVSLTDGLTRTSATRRVTAYVPTDDPPPARSATLAHDAARDRLWTVNRDHDSVSVVDAGSLAVVDEIDACAGPRSVALAADGTAWVSCEEEATIEVFDAATLAHLDTIVLDRASRPVGLAHAPAGDRTYVALDARGEVVAFDTATRAEVDRVAVGPRPYAVAVSGDSQTVWVSRLTSPDAGGIVYVLDRDLTGVDELVLAPDTATVDAEDRSRGLPNLLAAVAPSPDGTTLWVPHAIANVYRGGLRDGQALTHDSAIRSGVSRVRLSDGAELERLDLNDRAPGVDVAFTPLGDYAFVALQGNHRVQVLDAYTGQPVTGLVLDGEAVQGLAVSVDGRRLFVHHLLSRSVSAYDLGPLVDGTSFEVDPIGSVRVVDGEAMPELVLRGKRIFHDADDDRMSRDGYVSCATCHPDGGHDGLTWDFTARGEGLRNTIDLRGRAGMRHGNVHWTGNFDEIQDFEHDIRGPFGGAGFLADADWNATNDPLGAPKAGRSSDLDALAVYVASLAAVPDSPWRAADGGLTAAAEAGRDLFGTLGCDDCHGGPEMTNSAEGDRFDVGTLTAASGQRLGMPLDGIDTPTVKGVWATAPYLHDGSAPTLRDVLTTANPEDAHGATSPLSGDAIDQLVAYLESLDETVDP